MTLEEYNQLKRALLHLANFVDGLAWRIATPEEREANPIFFIRHEIEEILGKKTMEKICPYCGMMVLHAVCEVCGKEFHS